MNDMTTNETIIIDFRGFPLEISTFFRKSSSSTPLVYLHGGGCSKEDFRASLERPELKEHSILSFDFPGCGNSPYPECAEFNIDELVNILGLVLKKLEIDKCILIGHSTGGLVAQLYTEKHPKQVEALISVEGNLSSDSCNYSRKITGFNLEEWEEKEFSELIQVLRDSGNKGSSLYADTLEAHASPRAFYDICAQLVHYSDNGYLAKRFAKLELPKLLIYGEENRDMKHVTWLSEGFSPLKLVEIPGSGHFPFHDNPDAFYKALGEFL
jgi:pimeloyl-ACP methyl ester carboxylesterase